MKKVKMKENDYLPINSATREDFKNFYSWTIEDASRAQAEWKKKNNQPGAKGPLFQWVAAQELKEIADNYAATGDKKHILEALFKCAMNDLPMPRWCQKAYIEAYRDVWFRAVTSWDDVFGCPHPKGTHANDFRILRNNAEKVLARVEELTQEDDSPVDQRLFERIGRELGIGGKTKTAELYYMAKKMFL